MDDYDKIKLKILLVDGLIIDGGHHKQWFLEEALKLLGYDLVKLRKEMNERDYDWEDGIPP